MSLPEKYCQFLNLVKQLVPCEYILVDVTGEAKITSSSIELSDFFSSWQNSSSFHDILPERNYNALRHIAGQGNGMFIVHKTDSINTSFHTTQTVALSLIKGFVSILYFKDEVHEPNIDDIASSCLNYYMDVFLSYNISNNKIDLISSSVFDVLGYTPGECYSFSPEDLKGLLHPDEIDDILMEVKELIKVTPPGDRPYTFNYLLKDHSGNYHNMQLRSIIHFSENNTIQLVGILKDITEKYDLNNALKFKNQLISTIYRKLKEAENNLFNLQGSIEKNRLELEETHERAAATEEIFRQLAENTNDILWLRDEKEILYINSQFERIWGRSRKEIIEDPYETASWIHPDDMNNFEPWINLSKLIKGTPYVEQYRIVKPGGEIRWLWSRQFPICDKNNIPYRIVGIATDITEQKEYEDVLRIAKEKAQESDMLKSTFLANISHEIRTPMNGIVGFAELLSRNDIDATTRTNYITIMKKSSDQLIRIIDDIIDFAKIEANQIRIMHEKIDIDRLLDQLLIMFQPHLNQSGKEKITLSVEQPAMHSGVTIYSDEQRINQILSYLIDNAIKYTSEGFVKVGYSITDDTVRFYVTDSGIGIPKDKHELIFERFRQVDEGNTRKYGGTGLGLPIAKGLVNLLGGNIWVESEINKGSTFSFTIPVSAAKEETKETKNDEIAISLNLKNKLVMVAEDDELNFEYMKLLLEPTEAKIIHAKDGSQVIKICSNLNFDLILMDIRLPVLNGIQATRHLRAMGIKTPIIAQTAYAMDDDEDQCLKAGCDSYITKPINKEKLFQTIKFLLKEV